MTTDDDIIICRCEEVTKGEILRAIKAGATTPQAVKRFTRAGMGLCQGRTCRRLIAQIIAQETGQSIADIVPSTYRPPTRPLTVASLRRDNREVDR
ncbi:MAG: (2Fe-2S)-binding protein [Firmicutes bacterium]|nr:(2Fe-2S)-binding protein [Bacillota bacterium]